MAATKVWTLEDLDALPDDGNRYEVVFGELLMTPAPGPTHEEIAARLAEKVLPYVLANGLGRVYLAHSVVEHEGSRVQPDLIVRQPLKLDAPWNQQPVPLLVVEVLSPSNRAAHRAAKRAFYPKSGVGEYWVVDPPRRAITSVRAGAADVEMRDHATWRPHGVSEPLAIDLGWLFAHST